jgi:RNA polymerase sigma-70 factor (ECF subfamily)
VDVATHGSDAQVAPQSDDALWASSLAGDGGAFGALFDRHRERVYRHARRLAVTRHDAEDVVASAFLELWRHRNKVRLVDGSVLPWLLITTTNVGRNASRAQRRYRQFLERLPRAPEQPDAAEVALGTHALGTDARLREGLGALSKTDAQLFALVSLEDYPVGVAAELLGLSVPAARARLHRVRGKLREQFEDHAPVQKSDADGGTR